MFKHIVMWKLKDDTFNNDWKYNAAKIKHDLELLSDIDPGILKIEVGIDMLRTNQSYDVVLVSEFADKEAFNQYANHPKHLDVVKFIKEVVISRIAVDYEK